MYCSAAARRSCRSIRTRRRSGCAARLGGPATSGRNHREDRAVHTAAASSKDHPEGFAAIEALSARYSACAPNLSAFTPKTSSPTSNPYARADVGHDAGELAAEDRPPRSPEPGEEPNEPRPRARKPQSVRFTVAACTSTAPSSSAGTGRSTSMIRGDRVRRCSPPHASAHLPSGFAPQSNRPALRRLQRSRCASETEPRPPWRTAARIAADCAATTRRSTSAGRADGVRTGAHGPGRRSIERRCARRAASQGAAVR